MYLVLKKGRKSVTRLNQLKPDEKNVEVMDLKIGDLVRVKDNGNWVGPLEVIEIDEHNEQVELLG